MKQTPSEPLGQQLVKSLSNVCFGFFVVAVLVFTVIAVTYQPTDPWLEPARSISEVLNSVESATFKPDESVLRTGEDFAVSPSVLSFQVPAISESVVEGVEHNVSLETAENGCDWQERSINCSDPGVLAAIVKFNLKQFSDLNFYAYQTPVRGLNEDECDVAWRFRAANEKSWRKYRDYRRYSLTLDESCTYKISKVGAWHSGKNGKPFRIRRGPFGGYLIPRDRRTGKEGSVKNLTVLDELEVIEDNLPVSPSETAFRNNKYLYYSAGGDRCKGMSHFLWSFLCALGEAQYLNRTFVVDLSYCLSGSNNPGHGDEDDKDFRLYFDFAHLKEEASVIEEKQFRYEWRRSVARRQPVSVMEVKDFKITPMQLRKANITIIKRSFDAPEPDNYWYRVCEGETEKVVQRPWNLLWKSKRLMDIVNGICGKLEWDFDAVHVVRGEKAKNKELWPSLDSDTSPKALLDKLTDKIEQQRSVYIATNEVEPGYFDRLKERY
eukprot:c25895_g1_i1 orf=231-1712(+)